MTGVQTCDLPIWVLPGVRRVMVGGTAWTQTRRTRKIKLWLGAGRGFARGRKGYGRGARVDTHTTHTKNKALARCRERNSDG